jgi:hypothetical protein
LQRTTEGKKKSHPRPAPSTAVERIGKASLLSRMKRVGEKGQLREINSPCMLPAHVAFDLMNRARCRMMIFWESLKLGRKG